MELKSLKINKNLHKSIKMYCAENDINMYIFVEKLLQEKINKLNDNNSKIKSDSKK